MIQQLHQNANQLDQLVINRTEQEELHCMECNFLRVGATSMANFVERLGKASPHRSFLGVNP